MQYNREVFISFSIFCVVFLSGLSLKPDTCNYEAVAIVFVSYMIIQPRREKSTTGMERRD